MSRKYNQRGYMERDRERKRKPPPRSRGASGRIETKFQLITRCNNCAAEFHVQGQIQSTDRCQNCGTDLHTCRNCLHFDPAARNECTEPVEFRITNKSSNNICTFFEPKTLIEKKGSGAAPPKREDSHRQAFHDLFKK